MRPKLSIIMPVVDVPHGSGRPHFGLRHAITSCTDQSGNFELLIGADGPQPKIKELVDSIGSEKIRYFEYQYTGFWGNHQRNHLIKEATGTHVTYLDHDDSMLPDSIPLVLENAEMFPDRPIMYQMVTHHGHVKWAPTPGGSMPVTEETIPPEEMLKPDGQPDQITRYIDCAMGVFPIEGVVAEWAPEENYNADWVFFVRTLNWFKKHGKKLLFVPVVFKAMRPMVREMIVNGLAGMTDDERDDFDMGQGFVSKSW